MLRTPPLNLSNTNSHHQFTTAKFDGMMGMTRGVHEIEKMMANLDMSDETEILSASTYQASIYSSGQYKVYVPSSLYDRSTVRPFKQKR